MGEKKQDWSKVEPQALEVHRVVKFTNNGYSCVENMCEVQEIKEERTEEVWKRVFSELYEKDNRVFVEKKR